MNITDPNFKWTPACATDIRVTFRKAMQHTEADDWNSRLEGALEVMRKLSLNVTRLEDRRARK